MINEASKAKIFQADLGNILRKVKSGKPLSQAEKKTIEAATVATPEPAKPTERRQRSQADSIRWSIGMAAREFGLAHKTVAQRVTSTGTVPDEDGLFSTAKIHAAIFGDFEAERLRKIKEEADKLALENDKTRGQLVETEAVYKHFEGIFVGFRARILSSGLADIEKDEILNDLRRLKSRDLSKRMVNSDDPDPAGLNPDPAAPV